MAKKSIHKREVIHPNLLYTYAGLAPDKTTKQRLSSKINWNIRRLKGMQAQLSALAFDLKRCQTLVQEDVLAREDGDTNMLVVIKHQLSALVILDQGLASLICKTYQMQEVVREEVMGKKTVEEIEGEKGYVPF